MRRLRRVVPLLAGCMVLLYGLWPRGLVRAQDQNLLQGALLIGQIRLVTNNEFISLYNNTASDINMSTIQLAYYNFYDLTNTAKLTTSRFIALSGTLPAHNYYVVSEGTMSICYKMMVNSASLGFSTTAGTVQVVQNGPSNVLDSVAWSKTAVTTPANIQTLPTGANGFLQRAWLDGIPKTSGDPWISVVPSGLDGCGLQTQIAASSTPAAPAATGAPQHVSSVAAPVAESTAAASNTGLVAPEITELFPNPKAPQLDDNDEFIELYNPNDAVFTLNGYRLEAGTSYSRGFTFATGSLQPKSYTTFMITDTNLQLSNAEGQVRLLAPDGTTLSEAPGYEDAPDGESWSIIGDSWQWTDTPTPNAVNLPSASSPAIAKTAASTSTSSKKAKSSTDKKSTGKVAGASTTSSSGNSAELNDAAPLHPAILAGVGSAAVAYGLYEYRQDLANRLFQLRRYLRLRRTARQRV